jgi:hypothetical protein
MVFIFYEHNDNLGYWMCYVFSSYLFLPLHLSLMFGRLSKFWDASEKTINKSPGQLVSGKTVETGISEGAEKALPTSTKTRTKYSNIF